MSYHWQHEIKILECLPKPYPIVENAKMVSENRKMVAKKEFINGFMSGLAAPVLFYQNYFLPPIPQLPQISAPTMPLDQCMAENWRKIGGDIDVVIKRHGEISYTQK
jgi:hypothetical protein